jgi:hypothetical protein
MILVCLVGLWLLQIMVPWAVLEQERETWIIHMQVVRPQCQELRWHKSLLPVYRTSTATSRATYSRKPSVGKALNIDTWKTTTWPLHRVTACAVPGAIQAFPFSEEALPKMCWLQKAIHKKKNTLKKWDKFVFCHYENYSFYNRHTGKEQKTTGNRYYHVNVRCLRTNKQYNRSNIVVPSETELLTEDMILLNQNGVYI